LLLINLIIARESAMTITPDQRNKLMREKVTIQERLIDLTKKSIEIQNIIKRIKEIDTLIGISPRG